MNCFFILKQATFDGLNPESYDCDLPKTLYEQVKLLYKINQRTDKALDLIIRKTEQQQPWVIGYLKESLEYGLAYAFSNGSLSILVTENRTIRIFPDENVPNCYIFNTAAGVVKQTLNRKSEEATYHIFAQIYADS